MTKKALVELDNVSKIYQMGEVEVPALEKVSLKINKGEFVAVIGESGSGKSTMMNLIGCLDTPTKGSIKLKSKDINSMPESKLAVLRGKTIGFVFQQYNLVPNMNAFANVILPLELQEVNQKRAEKRALDVLETVGLSDKLNNLPSQLSGGQQQRVSIARCLAVDPKIILADEPTGALDSVTGKELLELLTRLWEEENKTIIMITHDLKLARYANKIIELKDGKIVRVKENKNHKKIKLRG